MPTSEYMYVRMMVCNFTTVDYNISLFVSLFAASSSCEFMVFFLPQFVKKFVQVFQLYALFYFQMIFRKKFAITKW